MKSGEWRYLRREGWGEEESWTLVEEDMRRGMRKDGGREGRGAREESEEIGAAGWELASNQLSCC